MKMDFKWRSILLFAIVTGLLISCEEDEVSKPLPEIIEEDTSTFVGPGVYQVFEIDIQVENNAPVVSKDKADYLNCSINIDGKGVYDDYQGTARIRGRGNSTWFWYDKKPYRIKLDEKSEILGLKSDKDWVLLANYRDPTDLMNTFGFEVAQFLGLPYTNNTRYIEVTLNGDYIGLYQLTEQVEQGTNRVNVDKDEGLLICLDLDDGPSLNPGVGDNFWSEVFKMPVCVKYPEDPTVVQISAIKADFAKLEKAINDHNYYAVDALIDIQTFIDYLILQELVYNVEIDAPRSTFLYKDKAGKYVMGPVWDFDAGFDFDWGTMYTGHNFFNAQELVLGTDPANHKGGYRIPDFFTQMFRNRQFIEEYKSRWNGVRDTIFEQVWMSMECYADALQDALARDFERWPIDRNYTTETERMKNWLSNRVSYLNTVINNYP
ncbi:MAG: CotH kinase family protein [Bacteroidales bacterium]|nr:CotH kinase family protein [Bacteroidales bacterium]